MRGHRPQRLPVVLTENEVRRVLSNLQGTPALVAQILYGSGLRLIKSPCYRRASKRRCSHTYRAFTHCTRRIFLRDGGAWNCLMLWRESMSTLLRSGAGSGYFPNSIDGGIEKVENKGATTSMPARYRKRCVQQCKQQASTSPQSVTHYAILSGSATLAFGQVRPPTYWSEATISVRSRSCLVIAM